MADSGIISMAIIITAAATIGAGGGAEIKNGADMAKALEPILG